MLASPVYLLCSQLDRPKPSLFAFLRNKKFRILLEDDYVELQRCMAAGAYKAVHVLAGSIVESLLLDLLESSSPDQADELRRLPLGTLIERAHKSTLITDRTAKLSAVIQDYRNLIHPGRAQRQNEIPTLSTAQVALALVPIVSDDVSRKLVAARGLSAEQILAKLKSDPGAVGIVSHLLHDASPDEIERLIQENLPQAYSEWDRDDVADAELGGTLVTTFEVGFARLDDPRKRRIANWLADVFRNGSDAETRSYGLAFGPGERLQWMEARSATLVRDYLVSKLTGDLAAILMHAMKGIGPHLDDSTVEPWIDGLVRAYRVDHLREATANLFQSELFALHDPCKSIARERLAVWSNHFLKNGNQGLAKQLDDLMIHLDFPF